MIMYDIINRKKNGQELTLDEIKFLIDGYVFGSIPNYQMSALLMAICLNGMTEGETINLTLCMANSGEILDLSSINGIKADKHSTGGVGDKTTLIVAPIVAACGLKVAKMSGRGLGFTGGTIDKLESIEGFNVGLTLDEFIENVKDIGISIVSQLGNLAPADKKIYAIRDVTATVDCIPLIASSIMSKKIASGADTIVLDVKVGSGAFMKSADEAEKLAKLMIKIGESQGRKVSAIISNMDVPLGNAIGNSLEVLEAIDTLCGNGPKDLYELCIYLASKMLSISGFGEIEYCRAIAEKSIENKSAFNKFKELVKGQGGDTNFEKSIKKSKLVYEVKSNVSGYIQRIDSEKCGLSSLLLGAGRKDLNDEIDHSAGIVICKKVGDFVNVGDTLALLHTNDQNCIMDAENKFISSLMLGDKEKVNTNIVLKDIEV